MLAWMTYAVVVTLILGVAAFAAEKSAHLRRAPSRWMWATSIFLSLLLPLAMATVSIRVPDVASAVGKPQLSTLITLRQVTMGALQPSAWLEAAMAIVAKTPNTTETHIDSILTTAWAATSGLAFLVIALNVVLLRRQTRAWKREPLAGVPIYVSEDVGPAVVGFCRPRIVAPRWVTRAAPETQALILAHEQSHLDAGDAQLLAFVVLLIAAFPWNLPLWWQLRRLRFAVEIDCDARVLRAGHEVSRYGEALITVGERQSGRLAAMTAMSEPKSLLEQRIRKMVWKPKKYTWASAAALAGLGVVLAAAAAEISPPASAGPLSTLPPDRALSGPIRVSAVPMKRYRNSEWNFALDVPAGWAPLPPVPTDGPYEVVRFLSSENGIHSLIIFRNDHDPGAGHPELVVKGAQEALAKAGFSNFVSGKAKIGPRTVTTLDFDKRAEDGKTWSVREYFILDGTLTYVLGFGTTDRSAMFALFDRMARSFTLGDVPA